MIEPLGYPEEKAQTLIRSLGRALLTRDLDDIREPLNIASAALLTNDPVTRSPEFIDYIARCLDLDWNLIQIVGQGFARIQHSRDLTMRDRAHLDIAEGLLCFHHSRYDDASISFHNAAVIANRIPDDDLISISCYYQARTEWRKAQYQAALGFARVARTHAKRLNLARRLALIAILEGWLQFLLGDFALPDQLIGETEKEVTESNDHVTKGDLQSYKGRRARAAGALEDAVRHFEDAISQYAKFDPEYRNVARCHQSIAYVRHLQIRQLLDEEANQRRSFVRSREIQADALNHSLEAERIYDLHQDRTRTRRAKVLNDRALLCLDIASFAEAAELAAGAYALAQRESQADAERLPERIDGDPVTMANSRIISCLVHLELDENLKALAFAKQAVELANRTENRRARARAAIHLARVLLRIGSPVEASRLHSQASLYLEPEKRLNAIHDPLVRDLETLRREIDGFTGDRVDPMIVMIRGSEVKGVELRSTLKRVETEVIRHVYEALNKNMEATAIALGINHMRVRRAVGPARGRSDS